MCLTVVNTADQKTKTGAGNIITSYVMMRCGMPNTIKSFHGPPTHCSATKNHAKFLGTEIAFF